VAGSKDGGVKKMFAQLSLYLSDPVVIFGLVVTLGLLLVRFLMARQVLGPWPKPLRSKLPAPLLDHVYVLGIVLMLLGVVWKQGQMQQAAQHNAVRQLLVEYDRNLVATKTLSSNITDVRSAFARVHAAMREPESEIMQLMFPAGMIPPSPNLNITKVVEASFAELRRQHLFDTPAAMQAFNTAKSQVRKKISPHLQTLENSRDVQGNKYIIHEDNLQIHKEILQGIGAFDLAAYDDVLVSMQTLRNGYDLSLNDASAYFAEAKNFLERDTFIGNGDVYEILTKEQKAYKSLSAFGQQLQQELQSYQQYRQVLANLLRDMAPE
jgi:hypothetical protein